MVQAIYKFASFDPKSLHDDIALLQIQGKLDLNNKTSQSIGLPEEHYCPYPGDQVLVSGWGTQEHNPHLADFLKHANFTVRANPKCNQKITRDQFCAGGNGVSLEYGDNGDPAVENMKLVGIGLWRQGLYSSSQEPSIFVCVGNYTDWIRRIIG